VIYSHLTLILLLSNKNIVLRKDYLSWRTCQKVAVASLLFVTSVTRSSNFSLLLLRITLQNRDRLLLSGHHSMGDALHKQRRPTASNRSALSFCVIAAIIFALLVGCGYSGPTNASTAVGLTGNVHGGRQPVSGSTIQLYAAGTDGDGSVALPLLSSTVKTDSNGNFTIPAAYGCPSASSPVYVLASGGSPGTEASNNPDLALTAVLGPCGGLSASTPISVNEVTTVGSVFPLAAYMNDAKHLGSASGSATFLTAVATVPEFINSAQGTSPGTPTTTSYFAESAKLNSLADALADCVNSAGGSAGDGSPCGQLFAAATPAGGTAPSDTVTAALRIAQNPKNNVANIYSMAAANPPFEPALTTPPTNWALALSYAVATPDISLPTGTYNGAQEVTLDDSTAGSTLYYTTDGTVPSTSSNPYTGPIAVSVTTTLQAIAVLQGSDSTVASSTLTIAAANPAENLVFQQQPSNTATGATMTPAVTVRVEDSNGNVVPSAAEAINLTLVGGSGLQGTLTITPQNGIATFNDLSVSAPGSGYTLLATSPSVVPAASAPFVITPTVSSTPVTLAFLQPPSNALTKAAIAPAVTVVVEDGSGNPVTNSTNPVTLALTGVSGLAGTLTATPQDGIATFSNLSVGTAGTYTLTATSPSLTSATSASFVITALGGSAPPPPVKLAFQQQPTNASTGATIAPAVTVVVEDSNGNTVPTAVNPVTLTLVGGTGLAGTLSVIPKNGIATFNNLNVSNAGTYSLAATSTSLVPAVSTGFTISAPGGGAPVAAKLAFLQQPSDATAGATIAPAITVAIEDSNGNTVTAATNPVTLALGGGTGLAGTLTATPQNGIATFSALSVGGAGTFTLSATSTGLTQATSSSFTITTAGGGGGTSTPTQLAFSQQPSNASTGAAITPAVKVVVEDSSGTPVTSTTSAVTIALTTGSGLTGTLTATPQNGIATFANLSVSAAGTYTLTASSVGLTAATSSGFTISTPSSGNGANYYISPTGSDSNSGTSAASPWYTPNHPMTCGQTITALAGTYSSTQFGASNWGTVSCPAGNNVAWVNCATFAACTITASGTSAMQINSSYWGVSGFVNTTTSPGYACFNVTTTGTQSIHHIILANDVCNSAYGGGFQVYNESSTGITDYIAFVGDIAYNAAQGSDACHSGFTIGFIRPSDTVAGTHLYVAGNYAWDNLDPSSCAGTAATDGEGIIIDTLKEYNYNQQVAIENNIVVGNGGRGILQNNNNGTTPATVYIEHNTAYGNNTQAGQAFPSGQGDIMITEANDVTATGNLAMTSQASVGSNAIYAFSLGGTGNTVSSNWLYSAAGNTTYGSGYGTNVTGISPAFANPVIPGAPSCSGTANVPACAATLIANFTPTNASAKPYGYQTPSTTSVTDPLFPAWLCNVNLPSGLVTPGCATAAVQEPSVIKNR
jgi:hypothetical protein